MSHQTNNILNFENIINFSILGRKKSPIFQIYKGRQWNQKYNEDNLFCYFVDPKDFVISQVDSIRLDETEEFLKICSKGDNSLTFKDSLSQKEYKKNKKENLHKKHKKVNKSFKKELRKNNNDNLKKNESKNTLIRPVLFEEDLNPVKNEIQKDENKEKKLYPGINFIPTINFPCNNYINIDFSKKINNFYGNNNLIFPNPLKSEKIVYNTLLSNTNTLIMDKPKIIETKPVNTFNIFKNSKNIISLFDEKIKTTPTFITETGTMNNPTTVEFKTSQMKCVNNRKGRKSKNSKKNYNESKHTKFSEDNMMRKIKNKIIESSRLLANKLLEQELKEINDKHYFNCREFRKIKGSFSQELNIKFNLYFYQMKIKEIFSLELSHKYTAIENHSNKEIIDYIFSEQNKNFFNKTKQVLDMPFHQYYHDIFLGEEKKWKEILGIGKDDDKYQIENLLKSLEEKPEDSEENNEHYAKCINKLAHNYEKFFLSKKTRNVELGNKKEDCIKSFMAKTTQEQYDKYFKELEQFKKFYEDRSGTNSELKSKSPFILFHNIDKNKYDFKNIEKNNNNYLNCLNNEITNHNSDSTEKKTINNNENVNKLNNTLNITDVKYEGNNDKKNEFCGKKRKFDCKKFDVNELEDTIEI